MDGVQRNFNMMAEKIDRMRCLRERCDNYVRLIKLTLDETIQEQNSLLDGSAFHNKLKYLGLVDKPKLSSNRFNFDKNIHLDNKYKYLMFDDHIGIKKNKNKTNLYTNGMYQSNNYDDYRLNNKPQIHDYSSSVYDNYNGACYMPVSSKRYGKTMNYHSPNLREYQVYYFPTSKPIAQYPRQTTERFYKRKPVQQYPEEEVPYWPTRYRKPVRIIEREPSYPIIDYGYRSKNNYYAGNTNIDYTPEYSARYCPTNDNMYNSYDNYYEADLGHRSFSTITRPCSPVYTRDILYNKTSLENSESLLEKKIRDYVWNPYKERAVKYSTPSYERSTYYSDFKPLQNKRLGDEVYRTRPSLELDSQVKNRKNSLTKENKYTRNSIMLSPERKPLNNESFDQQDDDDFLESISHKKKPETPTNFSKRISFDLDKDDADLHTIKTPVSDITENTNENFGTKERELLLKRRESTIKHDEKRRTSLLSNDDYPVSVNKSRVLSNDKSGNSRRESLNKPGKLTAVGNSFESDKYLNLNTNVQENGPSSFEKNVPNNYKDIERVDYDHNDTYNDHRRSSNDNSRIKPMGAPEQSKISYHDEPKNISNKINSRKIAERRESFKDEPKFKKENISGNKMYSNNIDNQLEKDYNKPQNGINESSKNIINPPINDFNHVEKYKTDEEEIVHPQQLVNTDNNVENHSETILPYQVVNDSNKEPDLINSPDQDSTDFKTISNEQETPQEIVNETFITNTEYYQDQPSDNTNEHPIKEYETQPENVDEHIISDENYYPDVHTDSNKEMTTDNRVEVNQNNEFVDGDNVHDEYYYQNPTDETKETPIENQYEKTEIQPNDTKEQHADDDYYYQNNYSNVDAKEQPENQLPEQDHQGEYVGEHTEHDEYYYQEHERNDVKEQQGDQQYNDPNYQGNYEEQPAQDDYYYQNYDNTDQKGQPENQYTDSSQQEKYVPENANHDDYYYQNHPEENTNENQVDQHYVESEHQGPYANEEQSNYYYEDNSNVKTDMIPPAQYDEHAQQESYRDDQHVDDNYYYQKQNENYDETVPKEQYEGYVGDQHDNNATYYPDSQADNYDQQQNYENNSFPAQQPDYAESYEQNPKSENYDYSDNVDENQSTNQVPNEPTKQ